MKHCEDEDELNEAVCFLHMQGEVRSIMHRPFVC